MILKTRKLAIEAGEEGHAKKFDVIDEEAAFVGKGIPEKCGWSPQAIRMRRLDRASRE
jgi:hypothetical protein